VLLTKEYVEFLGLATIAKTVNMLDQCKTARNIDIVIEIYFVPVTIRLGKCYSLRNRTELFWTTITVTMMSQSYGKVNWKFNF
jgi:hypothetical protein